MYNGHYGYTNAFYQYYPYDSYPLVMDSRNMDMSRGIRPQQSQQPQQCQCDGSEALCVSVPVPLTVVLFGTKLQVELECLKITSEQDITPALQKLVRSLGGLLGGSGSTSS
ncbi:hypothetical protein [Ectobacillus funiculus]|uniref:Uncharacterized protein n=1 Tax=Ectobacillus funiculus TaxID=137993 RepID=A0ABV5WIA0_9BACI